jgi:hypothetical protein
MNKGINIQLQVVNALEKSQELIGVIAAYNKLLCRLGFTDISFLVIPCLLLILAIKKSVGIYYLIVLIALGPS